MRYECSVCGYVYDEDVEGRRWSELPDDWVCPICGADKGYCEVQEEAPTVAAESKSAETGGAFDLESYLSEWKRPSDDLEGDFAAIQHMAISGDSSTGEPSIGKRKVTPASVILRISPRLKTWNPPESVRIGPCHWVKS